MAYNPTVWATGDIITAEKLNKMEGGIAGAGLQLYGPYVAINSDATVQAGKDAYVEMKTLEDVNGISVTYPQSTDAIIIPYYFSASSIAKCVVREMYPPYESNGSWGDAALMLFNVGNADSTGSVRLAFYSTVEFPQDV